MEELYYKRDQMKLFRQDYLDLKGLLEDFPKKPTQPAYVPFGNVAFLKGEFRETNEITVSLGAEYYAQVTAKDAIAILDRRLQLVESILEEMEKELALSPVNKMDTDNYHEDDVGTAVDIREDWTEEDEAFFLSKVGPSKPSSYEPSQTTKVPTPSQASKAVLHKNQPAQAPKPNDAGPVKSKIVERAPRKQTSSTDPSQIILGKQVKESLFKRRLKDAYDGEEGTDDRETLAP